MPVGDSLSLSAQAYRTSPGLVGNGLFWLVGSLSLLTAWLLLGTWRHTGKRLRTQEALVAETNFRRAMENSLLTGMRALDLQGRITYVNAAFCQMTGWDEAELVGQLPPYPYWPQAEYANLMLKLKEELSGKTVPGGFQIKVQRKNGTCFDARLYVSPLVDAHGQHTGWMSSITDITEAQPHPRPAGRLPRALHHRAGIPGCLGLRRPFGQCRTAICQQIVPPVVWLANHRASAAVAGSAGLSKPARKKMTMP